MPSETLPVVELDRASTPDAIGWDHESVHAFRGTYDAYIFNEVSKVFPALRRELF